MLKAGVYYNGVLAGYVEKRSNPTSYLFTYTEEYYADPGTPPISLSFPKSRKPFESNVLFPFFYGLLAEGINRDIQCMLLKIDEEDDFTRLIKTAGADTIGAITVKEITVVK